MNTERLTDIKSKLTAALQPTAMEVIDESHLHAGHAGAQSGKGHFRVHIVSDAFTGKKLLQRHRLVYDALGDLMETSIHALSIHAHSPDEVS